MKIEFNIKCDMCKMTTMTRKYDVTLNCPICSQITEEWRLCANCRADIKRVKDFCNAEIIEIKEK